MGQTRWAMRLAAGMAPLFLCELAAPLAAADTAGITAPSDPHWGFTQFIVKNRAPGKTPVGQSSRIQLDDPGKELG